MFQSAQTVNEEKPMKDVDQEPKNSTKRQKHSAEDVVIATNRL